MKQIMNKIINKNTIYTITALLLILHPIIELDYLAYPFLDSYGLPRFTTIVDLIIIPLLIIGTFILFEKNKKKVVKFISIYGLLFGIYFIFHCINAKGIIDKLYLTDNYYFLLSDEIVYTYKLLLPFVFIWVAFEQNIKTSTLKHITVGLSTLISVPILISNIFVFGFSTYEGNTIDNFLSWFSLPFNDTINKPRFYASKFFFDEGNTIGIVLFIILPLLYYFLYKENNSKKKMCYGLLIVIQSLSMIILSTRVATYGSFLIPVAMLVIYLFLIVIKQEKFKLWFVSFAVIIAALSAIIYPYCPAKQNQMINAESYEFQKLAEPERAKGSLIYKEGSKDLVQYSEEWFGFYTYMFEEYSYLVRVTPPVYYTKYYNYKHDPKFWVDLMFEYELEERIDGRQIQKIFTLYKWNQLTPIEKSFGMGYSTFMRGSILIEKDFVQQFYTYGPMGFVLIMVPWFAVTGYLGIKLLLGYKKNKWNYLNITLMMSLCLGLISSYLSGHTLDEPTSSLTIALMAGELLINLSNNNYVEENE